MTKTIGLVVPHAEDKVPDEGVKMYPHAHFVPKGVGVRSLTPEGYAAAFDAIMPAAEHLVKQGVDAIMVIGTSLTFYRGPEAHDRLLEKLRTTTGLPVSTMSQAIIDGLNEVGAKRVAVTTAYTDVVNQRLKELLTAGGFEVLSLEAFHLLEFGARRGWAKAISSSSAALRWPRRPAPMAWSSPVAACARSASRNPWKTAMTSRWCPRRRRRSGRRCG